MQVMSVGWTDSTSHDYSFAALQSMCNSAVDWSKTSHMYSESQLHSLIPKVKVMISFLRWLRTPPHYRHVLEEEDMKRNKMAQEAMIKTGRHLLIESVRKGLISPKEAAERSRKLSQQMMIR